MKIGEVFKGQNHIKFKFVMLYKLQVMFTVFSIKDYLCYNDTV